MRWVIIPEPIHPVDPLSDQPLSQEVSFGDFVRALRIDPKFTQAVDALEALDATRSIIEAKAGEAVPIQDATWTALTVCAKRPTTISSALIYSPGYKSFSDAITEAATKKPEAS